MWKYFSRPTGLVYSEHNADGAAYFPGRRRRRPGYTSRKIRKFRTDKVDARNKRTLTHSAWKNGWEPAVYMSCMSQNFRLFLVLNLSVLNFRIFLLMYPGSPSFHVDRAVSATPAASHQLSDNGWCLHKIHEQNNWKVSNGEIRCAKQKLLTGVSCKRLETKCLHESHESNFRLFHASNLSIRKF